MQYLVALLGNGEMPAWEDLTPEQQEAGMRQHDDFGRACTEREGVRIISAAALAPAEAATTMRTLGGEVVLTDGPFAEATEHFGGYYHVEAPDLDVLVELLKLLPGYDIEIRPVGLV